MIPENFEDILSYDYVYPVEEWVMAQFRKRVKKNQSFLEFLEEFALMHITHGAKQHREDEDWQRLRLLLVGRLYDYKQTGDFPTYALFILLDQALILEHDGHPIPNLLR